MSLIYLDNAATTFPKPTNVQNAVSRCLREYCGNSGRGSHPLSLAASQAIYQCRERLSTSFHADAPENVVFTMNATYAINLALAGLLHQGDHVLISDLEHNAVRRPLEALQSAGVITYSTFSTMTGNTDEAKRRNPTRICACIASALRPNTRAVICSHQSNLCSVTLPIEEIGAFCQRHGLLFFVDASQSAGHLSVDMQKAHIDCLCAPGHKGLFGIQGCGFSIFRQGLVPSPLISGGSGYQSLLPTMPEELPERLEAGTLPTPAIVGLDAGLDFLRRVGPDAIREHEIVLFNAARERLSRLKNYHLYFPETPGSTLLFHREGIEADRVGQYLANEGFCVRSGYHCAALAHQTLGTPAGGAVRISFSYFNHLADVDRLYHCLFNMERTHELGVSPKSPS